MARQFLRKSNSSLEVVTFLWIFSGYDFNIMNTLYEFAAKPSQCWKKLAVSFKQQFTGYLLKLTKSMHGRCLYNWCLIRLKSLALPKLSFLTLRLCSPYLLPKSTQFLHLSSLAYKSHVYNRIVFLPNTATRKIALSCCANF